MRVASVIPYTRTPRGTEHFSYSIPDELQSDVKEGSLVWIPFRSKVILGVVWDITSSKPTADDKPITLKPISKLYDGYQRWESEQQRAFLGWLAQYYYISLPAAFKVLQTQPLKRPRGAEPIDERLASVHATAIPQAHKSNTAILSKLDTRQPTLFHFTDRTHCLSLYNTAIENVDGHTLVLVPEQKDLAEVIAALPAKVEVWSTEQPSPSYFYQLEARLQQPVTDDAPSCVVIGTRRFGLMDLSLFSTVIIDQEESKAHKQFDLNPRYHIRRIAQWYANESSEKASRQPAFLFTSIAPSAALGKAASEKSVTYIDAREQWRAEHLQTVSMEEEGHKQNFSWFSEPLITAIQESKHTFLFLNRTGHYRMAICRDCDALLPAYATQCSDCRGMDLRQVGRGVSSLRQELQQLFPDQAVVEVDANSLPSQEELSAAHIVIGTEKVMRLIPLSHFDTIGILSVDHLLVYPHFQSHERVFQLLTELFAAKRRTILQTYHPEHPVLAAARRGDWKGFMQTELTLRKQFSLPPYGVYLQVREPRIGETTTYTHEIVFDDLPQGGIVNRFE